MTGSKVILDSALRAAVHLPSSKIPSTVAKNSTALLSSLAGSGKPAALPDLPYDYNALEPSISAETMELHHSKHHNTYVTNLNATVEKIESAMASGDVSGTIALQGALKFNGGGHINHCLFWENLSPNSSGPSSALEAKIAERFGSLDAMKEQMSATTVAVQGSGWGWLGFNPKSCSLEIATCANQDPLEATTGIKPLLGIDVWEHAYYVDYRNLRPKYVSAIWDIVNWDVVEQRLNEATK
mmetsp:Transcript_112314/g.324429  ORF Transcript_112314/g.324429 Transcript_112314/m.324429 type:complete len:241 (-) Transcript_112314:176-898(-)|eukprot:CAMPEP_0176026420 /NCGR_PEP_ID=MMETSP0120_2-20121206/12942_1 /TAXON_ID=160619 /ORGANISM="Kryptoperidinium foliaceum, Strain CCMP 1326" /LENGTH=240 /DNA_ID=CAMNT_0017359617 /DNA_START=43 /DNA_END=765 /DNA_ORIENTATION=-